MDFAVKIGASKERIITVNSNQTTSFLWKGENCTFHTLHDSGNGGDMSASSQRASDTRL